MLGALTPAWLGAGVESERFDHEDATRTYRRHGRSGIRKSLMRRARALCDTVPGFSQSSYWLTAPARTHVPILLIVTESPGADPHNVQNIDHEELAILAVPASSAPATPADLADTFGRAFHRAGWNGLPQLVGIADAALGG